MEFVLELKKTFFVLKNSGVNGWFIRLVMILAIIILILGYLIYRASYQNIYNKLALEANNIERYISVLHQESTILASYIGAEIVTSNIKDVNNITGLFKDLNDAKNFNLPKSLFWSSLIWINDDKKIVVSTKNGTPNHQIDTRDLPHFSKKSSDQWVVKVSSPRIDVADGAYIIPSGMSITDSNGKFFGTLGWGFDIQHLIDNISAQLLHPVKFLICDTNLDLYVASEISLMQKYRSIADAAKLLMQPNSNKAPIFLENNIFLYHKHSTKMPLIILVGYETKDFYKQIFFELTIAMLVTLGLGIFYVFLILYITSILIKTIHITEKLQDKMLSDTNSKLSSGIITVSKCSQLARDFIASSNQKWKAQILTSIESIISSADTLYSLFIKSTKPSDTCINSVLTEAIDIKFSHILAKGTRLKTNFTPDLPQIHLNTLSIKQVIVSILSRILSQILPNNIISIDTYYQYSNKVEMICISFQYKGFELNDEDITRLNKYNKSLSKDYTNLTLHDIHKIIVANNGNCTVYSENKDFITIELCFPVQSSKQNIENI